MIVQIDSKAWTVSLANTRVSIATGLSEMLSIPPNTGMLFDLRAFQTGNITINMQQMLFPLDVIFISNSGLIIDIVRNLQPHQNYLESNQFAYFLEINAGESSGLNVGDAVYYLNQVTSLAILDFSNPLIGLILAFAVMTVVKKISVATNPKRKEAAEKAKYAVPTETSAAREAKYEKRRLAMEEEGREIAQKASQKYPGVSFSRLDIDWRSARVWWFYDPQKHLDILARDYDELMYKLKALRRFDK